LPIEDAGPVTKLSDEYGHDPASARTKAAIVAEATRERVTRAPRPLRFFNSISISEYSFAKPDAVQNRQLKAKFLFAEKFRPFRRPGWQDPETDKSRFTFSANRMRIGQAPPHRRIG
jgi:hypothetical protein